MPEILTSGPYLQYATALLFGYLLGSIPFARMVNDLSRTDPIPENADGRIRVVDLYAAGHRGLAATALGGDILKGFFAAALPATTWGIEPGILAAFGAFIGHLYPAFAKFRGGSGIAPYFGALLLFSTPSALIMGAVWLLILFITRYALVASIAAVFVAPICLIGLEQWEFVRLFAGLAALVVVRNISGIFRLMGGVEPKVKF